MRIRAAALIAGSAVVLAAITGCTPDVPGPSPTSPLVTRAREEAAREFAAALELEATDGVEEIARADEDWCFAEGGPTGISLVPTGAEYSTVCLLEGAVVYAVHGADQGTAAAEVDAFLARNGLQSSDGSVVDAVGGQDLLAGPEVFGGAGPGDAASITWLLGDASRLQVDGLPLAEGYNRVSYEGTITEETPQELRATGASFALTVQLTRRYFSGTGDGELPAD
ncbi:hypothetical protein SAMN06295885_0237 [Rathayibacter oskolensis]|uniref:LppX_LprAFG lipoprotein n=1 Tax=Rathayibacter oskolensis TaxID=1891671 RepID=A0A1X7MVB2_9MICO|nr:hypothetical protein [Rathayibacter oskolensis]SMH28820.1 hypothetical protein SAMN06295885_0237 [Rathayibacter oskolensis]